MAATLVPGPALPELRQRRRAFNVYQARGRPSAAPIFNQTALPVSEVRGRPRVGQPLPPHVLAVCPGHGRTLLDYHRPPAALTAMLERGIVPLVPVSHLNAAIAPPALGLLSLLQLLWTFV